MQRSALCRSRRELSNEDLLAKFGFDTAENEPCNVCPLSAYRSPRFIMAMRENDHFKHELMNLDIACDRDPEDLFRVFDRNNNHSLTVDDYVCSNSELERILFLTSSDF